MAKRKKTDLIILHCAATKPSMDIDISTIDEWHRKRGFWSCGYHFVITRRGKLQEGRQLHDIGANAKGYNHRSIGICLVGGVTQEDHTVAENNFTEQQWVTLDKLLIKLLHTFPSVKIIGHNQVSDKDCPSFDVQTYLKDKPFSESGSKDPSHIA